MTKELNDYVSHIGPYYGVENLAIFLYSLAKMQRPDFALELGSGAGIVSLSIAQAMKENGSGKTLSLDNGQQWEKIRESQEIATNNISDYFEFLNNLKRKHKLDNFLDYQVAHFPAFPPPLSSIDMLIADYESQPAAIVNILKFYLPHMSECFSIFIDGASSYLPSFLFTERIVEQINSGKIPKSLIDENLDWWIQFSSTHELKVIHLTEKIPRVQNSTLWLIGQPVDYQPYPTTKIT